MQVDPALLAALQAQGFSIWQSITYFFVLPVVIIFHLIVVLQNLGESVVLSIFFWKLKMSTAGLILNCFIYGAFVIAIGGLLFYRRLRWDILDLRDQLQRSRTQVQELQNKLNRVNVAASQILVSCPLNQLVDKGLDQFVNENYKPGLLQAAPRNKITP